MKSPFEIILEQIKNNTCTSINLSRNRIGNAGAKDLADALKVNKTLSSIGLTDNQIGAAGAKDLADALKVNKTLSSIDLGRNQIGDAGAKDLADALKVNKTLSSIDLGGNQIGDAGAKDLADALKVNYTLLEITGVNNSEIAAYLERNQAIAFCLKPLHTFIASPSGALDGKTILESITALEKLGPNLNALEDEAYPSEAYRLLTALGHLTAPTDSLSLRAETESPQKDALACLLSPFAHPPFQKIADVALGHLLSGDFKCCFKPTPDAERARCSLVLHALREHLHKPEFMHFAYTALYELLSPDAPVTVQAREELIQDTALLNYQTLLEIIQTALDECRQSKEPNEYEVSLLEALASQKDYAPLTASTLCQSPAFIAAFTLKFPKVSFFTLPEHCLTKDSEASVLIKLPLEKPVPMTEQHLTDYAFHLSQSNPQAMNLEKEVKGLKHLLEKTFSLAIEEEVILAEEEVQRPKNRGLWVEEEDAASSEEIEIGTQPQSLNAAKETFTQRNLAFLQKKQSSNKPSLTQTFFGINNTQEWQDRAKQLRQNALVELSASIQKLQNNQEKLDLIEHALSLPLFNEHRSNYLLTGAFGNTAARTILEALRAQFIETENSCCFF